MQIHKINRRQAQQQRHHPSGERRNHDDKNRISEPLQARAHVQLGEVNAARDKRKTRNDKQHGTDITGFVLRGNAQEHLCQPQTAGVNQARRRNRGDDAQKQREMVLGQLAPNRVADTCAEKSKAHFPQTAAEQKCKRAARKRRGKAQRERGVQAVNLFDVIQSAVQLFAGERQPFFGEIRDKTFQPV